jgi:hypothetical protein
MMGTKQCAGCGTQIASAARTCPVCGRGSLVGELGMFAFLGVLLLGIGLASGLIPLDLGAARPEAAPTHAVGSAAPEQSKAAPRGQTSPAPRRRGRTHVEAQAVLAQAPCAYPDTSAVEQLLRREPSADSARLRSVACEASLGYQSTSPDTAPSEASASPPASAGATFITPSDSIRR